MLHARLDARVNTFTAQISDETRSREIGDIVSFVGRDASGSFGILAGREPFATSLLWGLCEIRSAGGGELFLAVAGGILFYDGVALRVATRRFLIDPDGARIIAQLAAEDSSEATTTRSMHAMLRSLDRELLRRLLAVPN